MIILVPNEIKEREYRVTLAPGGSAKCKRSRQKTISYPFQTC